jgi:hypothetical protein
MGSQQTKCLGTFSEDVIASVLGYFHGEDVDYDSEIIASPTSELAKPLLDHGLSIVETSLNIDTLVEKLKYRFENFVRGECSIKKSDSVPESYYVHFNDRSYKIHITANEINDMIIYSGTLNIT